MNDYGKDVMRLKYQNVNASAFTLDVSEFCDNYSFYWENNLHIRNLLALTKIRRIDTTHSLEIELSKWNKFKIGCNSSCNLKVNIYIYIY